MIDLRSARRQAYRYGRQTRQMRYQGTDGHDAVDWAWSTFLSQFSALEEAEVLVDRLRSAYSDGVDGDATTDVAFGYSV